eukprot:m51a1_g11764 hypothetical protein (148) ;mRNA; r:228993-229505
MATAVATRNYLRALSTLTTRLPWVRKSDIRGDECRLLYGRLMDTTSTQLVVIEQLQALLPQLLALGLDTAVVLRAIASVRKEMVPAQKLLSRKRWVSQSVPGAVWTTLAAQQRALALLDTAAADASRRIEDANRQRCASNSVGSAEP